MLIFYTYYESKKGNVIPKINYPEVYYYLGYIAFENKNFQKAREYYEKGLAWNPVNVSLRFELAATYRMTGDIERFKAEIEKIHPYIFSSSFLAKYWRELGWYYVEKQVYDLANALYTASINYYDTNIARNELKFIAEKENRQAQFSGMEDIRKLFFEYNIRPRFNEHTVSTIVNRYEFIIKEKTDINLVYYLSRVLYDITLDTKYMLYATLKDEKLGIKIEFPENWQMLKKELYKQYEVSENTVAIFRKPNNENVSVVCQCKCSTEEFEKKYTSILKDIEIKGIKIINSYIIEGEKKLYVIFTNTQIKESIIRECRAYLVENGYLFCISWKVRNNVEVEKILNEIDNGFEMKLVRSLKKIEEINSEKKEVVKDEVNLKEIEPEKTEQKPEAIGLKEYSQEIEGYPKFKFYFPEDLGEYSKTSTNIFELKKDNIQKIRVMISKCKSKDDLEVSAKNWIEDNKAKIKMEQVSYRKETINNIPIEVYVLQFIDKPKLAKRIYKIGFVNSCKITISGSIVGNKEEIINQAFEKIKWDESGNSV